MMKRLCFTLALALSGLSPYAGAQNLGEELKSLGEALRQSVQGVNQQPREAVRAQAEMKPGDSYRHPTGGRVKWQVRQLSSGTVEVNGQVSPELDLARAEVAFLVYREGCRAGGGGNGLFGNINAYQNGELVAQGNLRGCDAGNIQANFRKNVAAERRLQEHKETAHRHARETNQNIGNTRGLDGELLKELNAEVIRIKRHQTCRDGCKDFEVVCNVPASIGRADRANGVAERRFVGLAYLRFGGAAIPGGLVIGKDKRWHEELILARWTKGNGQWKQDGSGMWDPAVCRRGRS